MTITISWWFLPFILWVFIGLWYAIDQQDASGGFFLMIFMWSFMAVARFLP